MLGNNSLLIIYVRDAYMRACDHFANLVKWLFEPLRRFRSWREDEKYTKINKIVLSLHFYALKFAHVKYFLYLCSRFGWKGNDPKSAQTVLT